MLDCWKSDPALRPTFSDLAGRLDDLFQHSSRSVSAQCTTQSIRLKQRCSEKIIQLTIVYRVLSV